MRRFALSLLVIAGLSSLQACGAGLVGAFIASDNNSPPPAPPGLSLPENKFPLVPADTASTSFRTVVVANTQLQGTAGLQIEIRAKGVSEVQGSPVIVSGQGGSTVIGFLLRTTVIRHEIPDPTAEDVPGLLAVVASGREVAPPVPVELLRQPKAVLVLPTAGPNPPTELLLSPLGGSEVELKVSGLRALQAGNLQVLVTTADATGNSESVTRQCTSVRLTAGPGTDSTVKAVVPGNTFSGQAKFVVVDSLAGLSTEVTNAYYRPDVTVALPAQGPTTGGSLVTLIGRALAPLDMSRQPPTAAFDQVDILFKKGDREQLLPRQDLRPDESDLDRLVFTMPVSPDGRPGSVRIVLRVRLGEVAAEVEALEQFTFSNPQPVFGPRGAVLDRLPVASAPIRLESAPNGTDAPDFALLYSEAGVGFLQLLTAEENGMFIRFGGSRQLGNPANAAERDPKDLGIGDFDGDGVPDILAINGGSTVGTHQLTLGRPLPQPPLGPIALIDAAAKAQRCVAADLDRDGKQDFVLLPGQYAVPGALPSVWLARPRAQGDPAFIWAGNVPVRPGLREQILVQDLDGDGFLDVAVASGGLPFPICDIAYGNGTGSFVAGPQLDVTIHPYESDQASPLVGLHACGSVAPYPVVLVFATPLEPPTTGPAVALAVVLPLASRTYDPVVAGDQQPLPAPLVASLSADLDRDGISELVLAFRNTELAPLAFAPLIIARWTGTSFQPVPGTVERGSEELFDITALHFGTAFPDDPATTPADEEVKGVFVLHDSVVDGVREQRLSTLLVSGGPSGPSLLAPDAGGQVPFEVKSLVGGSYDAISRTTNGRTRDMACGTDNAVRILRNDGAGGFFSLVNPPQPAPRIVPATLTRMQASSGPTSTGVDSLAWLDRDSRLSVWLPFVPPPPLPEPPPPTPLPVTSVELRLQSPTPRLRTADVADSSRMVSIDVDGDSVLDLVVMLTFQVSQPGEGDALLFLLRGKATVQSGEFPFHLPTSPQAVTLLHGNSTSVALADFVRSASGPVQLEAAVAVPTSSSPQGGDGDHVRFYRYVPGGVPAEDRLARSSAGGPAALLAGDAPTQVAAADFDRNGTDDLLVAAAGSGEHTLRLFLNSGEPGSNPGEVNVAAFRESLTSPRPISPGAITALRLGDINGDRNVDALVSTQSGTATRSSAVAFYLSDGTGSFANPVFVSPTRIGNRNAVLSIDLSDFNGDSQLDLAGAWNTAGGGDRNVRVLFGGSR